MKTDTIPEMAFGVLIKFFKQLTNQNSIKININRDDIIFCSFYGFAYY